MKLVWSAFALADRDGIFTHIEVENPRAAIAIDERIAASAHRLVDFPESGRPAALPARENSLLLGTPYVAAYIVTERAIRVLRVLHGAQKWPDVPEG